MIELAASEQHYSARHGRVKPLCRRRRRATRVAVIVCARLTAAASERVTHLEATQQVIDSLLLDESDVVSQRARLVSDAFYLVTTGLLNVDTRHAMMTTVVATS